MLLLLRLKHNIDGYMGLKYHKYPPSADEFLLLTASGLSDPSLKLLLHTGQLFCQSGHAF